MCALPRRLAPASDGVAHRLARLPARFRHAERAAVDHARRAAQGRPWSTPAFLFRHPARLRRQDRRPGARQPGASISTRSTRTRISSWSFEEAYVDFILSDLELRVGKQKISWARLDELQPTDNLNPEDLSEFFFRPELERKIGIPALNGSCSPFTIRGRWRRCGHRFSPPTAFRNRKDRWFPPLLRGSRSRRDAVRRRAAARALPRRALSRRTHSRAATPVLRRVRRTFGEGRDVAQRVPRLGQEPELRCAAAPRPSCLPAWPGGPRRAELRPPGVSELAPDHRRRRAISRCRSGWSRSAPRRRGFTAAPSRSSFAIKWAGDPRLLAVVGDAACACRSATGRPETVGLPLAVDRARSATPFSTASALITV